MKKFLLTSCTIFALLGVAASGHAAGIVSQDIGMLPAGPGLTGHSTYVTAATTNATSVTSVPTTVHQVVISNSTATAEFLKLYNIGTAPTCGTTVPTMTIGIPASTDNLQVTFGQDWGEAFSAGLGFCVTGAASNTDTTNSVAGITVNFLTR